MEFETDAPALARHPGKPGGLPCWAGGTVGACHMAGLRRKDRGVALGLIALGVEHPDAVTHLSRTR